MSRCCDLVVLDPSLELRPFNALDPSWFTGFQSSTLSFSTTQQIEQMFPLYYLPRAAPAYAKEITRATSTNTVALSAATVLAFYLPWEGDLVRT
jgi:hypothetical protein